MIKEMYAYEWVLDSNQSHIRVYGISHGLDGVNRNICIRIEDFKPYAYIQIPDDKDDTVRAIIERLQQMPSPPIKVDILKKHHLYNFQNKKKGLSPFMFASFETKKQMLDMVYHLKNGINILGKTVHLKVHETSANPILQMTSLQDIPMSGWIEFSNNPKLVLMNDMMTACDEEYIVRWKTIKRSKRADQVVPKCMAFDMEVNSVAMNQFPSDKPGDCIFQISCVITEKDKDRRKILLSLKAKDMNLEESELLVDVKVHVFDTERELLDNFMNLIAEEKPNVITGFNIFGFDIEYAMKRSVRFFLADEFKLVGFNKHTPAPIEEVRWSSSAYKNQVFKFINWEGILLLDLLPIIRRDYKLDTYTLKNVTATFLNNNTKDPVTHKDIFTACKTREKMDVVGKYCVQDSDLCIELLNHLHIWVSLSEMAKVCNVSMFTLYTQGQQIKLYSQVYKYCLHENIVVDSEGYEANMNERYRGAHVIDPKPGFYERVVPCDFSSLYPSLIIAYNICYSTITDKTIPDSQCNIFEWEDHVGCEHDPKEINIKKLSEKIDNIGKDISILRAKRDNITAITVPKGTTVKDAKNKIQLKIDEMVQKQKPFREQRQELKKTKLADREDGDGNKISGMMCAKRYYRFLKPNIKKGVIPTIIQNLLDSRSRVKNLMKKCDNDAQKIVYDKEQLAYKVSANSMYGAMGVKRGYLPFMPGAMCVTYAGRATLEKTAELIQSEFKGILVYGDTDSNYVTFPHITSISETWDYAIKVADGVTNWIEDGKRVFPRPINLEFENTIYERFLILSKKRYMYQEISRDGYLNKKIGKKGVILARRDNSQLVRNVYEQVTSMIFDRKTRDALYQHVDNYVRDIYDNKLDYKDYVITKSVGDSDGIINDTGRMGDYKVKELPTNSVERMKVLHGRDEKDYYISCCPAQVQLAERMKKRGVPVDAGSRIEYVVIKKQKAVTLGQKIEDYEYFMRHTSVLQIDPKYYVDAMVNPLDQVFKTMGYGDMMKEISIKWDKIANELVKKPIFVIVKNKTSPFKRIIE
jgi:DNA polymerase elongation subunit (family B)